MMKDNRLISKTNEKGYTKIYCPHCKEELFRGFYMGITMRHYDNCPNCKKPVDMDAKVDAISIINIKNFEKEYEERMENEKWKL